MQLMVLCIAAVMVQFIFCVKPKAAMLLWPVCMHDSSVSMQPWGLGLPPHSSLAKGNQFYLLMSAAIYFYERAMWTNNAKERVFKKQFADYSRAELQRIVSFTSKSCSRQIEQELSATYAQLESQVEMAKQKLEFELNEMNQEVLRLQDIETNAKVYRNKSSWLMNELSMFMKEFGIVESTPKL